MRSEDVIDAQPALLAVCLVEEERRRAMVRSGARAASVLGVLVVMVGDGLPGLMPKGTGNQNRRNHYCGADSNGGKPIEVPDRPGRNSRCPCGSGRKYKACCLKGD